MPLRNLDDYISGQMPDDRAEAFEEQLFDAAAQGSVEAEDAAFVNELSRLSTWLARRGLFDVGSTRSDVEAIQRSGLKVHQQELRAGAICEITPWPEGTQIVVTRIDVDLRGFEDVDVIIETPDGTHIKTFRDVNYDPDSGALYGVCEEPLARIAFAKGHVISRVTATSTRDGRRQTVATFESRPATT